MLAEFVELVSELFPSVDPKTAARCLGQLTRADFDPGKLFRPEHFDHLTQGDIVDPVQFVTTDEDGGELEYAGPGLLLSNTCDADHEPHVIFAACYPLDLFLGENVTDENTLRSNRVYNLLYLPLLGADSRGVIADLSLVHSHSRGFVSRCLQQGSAIKVCSLSMWGFYLLLAKITIHLMRPEAREVDRGRDEG